MKKTKFFSIMTLMLALGITACVKPTPQSSEPPAGSSAAPVSSSVAPVSSVTPASSSVKPASSSVKPASSSVKPSSSSTKPSSSSAAPVEEAVAFTNADFVKVADADFLKINGTISGFANADAMKMAFGLLHKDAADGGLADPLDGEWLVGSAEPAAADYKYAPIVSAGEFEVSIPMAEVVFVKGAYEIYVGPKGHYAKVTLSQAAWGSGAVKAGGLKMILRGDRSLIFAEELPDIALTEATTFVEGEGVDAKVFIQVGGELGIEPEVFLAKVVKVTFERQVGGWKKTEMLTSDENPLVTLVVEGSKGYVKANITALDLGGYQVKLGFDGTSAPNTTMDTDSYDMRDNPTVLGNKEYAPYYAAGTNDAAHLYGCCGLFIEAVATQITQDTTRLEAENAVIANATVTPKGEDTAVSGESYLAGMTRTSGWNGKTSSADFIIRVPATSDYIVNIAYKCPATTTSALSLVVDGGAAIAIGTVAEAWTVASEVINLAAGAKHTISVRGVSGVTSQLDYIELVKTS